MTKDEANRRLAAAAKKGRQRKAMERVMTRVLLRLRQDIREEAHKSVLIEETQQREES